MTIIDDVGKDAVCCNFTIANKYTENKYAIQRPSIDKYRIPPRIIEVSFDDIKELEEMIFALSDLRNKIVQDYRKMGA